MKYKILLLGLVIILMSSFANAALKDSMVGCWDLNEASGTANAIDSTSYGHTGVVTGTPTAIPGVIGNARQLAPNDYITITNTATLEPSSSMTICGWANFSSATANGGLFSMSNGGSTAAYSWLQIHDIAGDSAFIYRDAAGAQHGWYGYGTGQSVTTNQGFKFVCTTFNTTHITRYWNGVKNTPTDDATPVGSFFDGNYNLYIGQWVGGQNYGGGVDEVMYWTRDLSPTEISTVYNSGAGTSCAGILNSAPNTPTPTLVSVDGTNYTTSNINCSATISDPEGNNMNVSVQYFNNTKLMASYSLNNNYVNGTIVSHIFSAGNFSSDNNGNNITCSMQSNDGILTSNWGNSTSLTLMSPPSPQAPQNIMIRHNYTGVDGVYYNNQITPTDAASETYPINFTATYIDGGVDGSIVVCSNNASTYASCNKICETINVTNQTTASCSGIPSTSSFNNTAYFFGYNIINGWGKSSVDYYYITNKIGDIPTTYSNEVPLFINTTLSATDDNPHNVTNCGPGETCTYEYDVTIPENAGPGNYSLFAYDSLGNAGYNTINFEVLGGTPYNNVPENSSSYITYNVDGQTYYSLNTPSNPISPNSWALNFTSDISTNTSGNINLVVCNNIATDVSTCNVLCSSPSVASGNVGCEYVPGTTGGFNRTAYLYTNGSWSNYTTVPYYVSNKGADIPVVYNSSLPFFINTSVSDTITNPYTASCTSGSTCSYNYTVQITNEAGLGNYTLFAYDSLGNANFNNITFEVKGNESFMPTVNTNLTNYTTLDWYELTFDINMTLGINWNETPECSIQDNVSWVSCTPVNVTVPLTSNETTFTCTAAEVNSGVVSMYANCTSSSWEINSENYNITINANSNPTVTTNLTSYAPNVTTRLFGVNVSGFNWTSAPTCIFNYNDTGLSCQDINLASTGVQIGENYEATSSCTVLESMNRTFSIYTTCNTSLYLVNSSTYELNVSYTSPYYGINTNLTDYTEIRWPNLNFSVNVSLGANWNETPQCSLQDNVSWVDCNPKYNTVSLDVNYTTVECVATERNIGTVSFYANCTSQSIDTNSPFYILNVTADALPQVVTNATNIIDYILQGTSFNITGYNMTQNMTCGVTVNESGLSCTNSYLDMSDLSYTSYNTTTCTPDYVQEAYYDITVNCNDTIYTDINSSTYTIFVDANSNPNMTTNLSGTYTDYLLQGFDVLVSEENWYEQATCNLVLNTTGLTCNNTIIDQGQNGVIQCVPDSVQEADYTGYVNCDGTVYNEINSTQNFTFSINANSRPNMTTNLTGTYNTPSLESFDVLIGEENWYEQATCALVLNDTGLTCNNTVINQGQNGVISCAADTVQEKGYSASVNCNGIIYTNINSTQSYTFTVDASTNPSIVSNISSIYTDMTSNGFSINVSYYNWTESPITCSFVWNDSAVRCEDITASTDAATNCSTTEYFKNGTFEMYAQCDGTLYTDINSTTYTVNIVQTNLTTTYEQYITPKYPVSTSDLDCSFNITNLYNESQRTDVGVVWYNSTDNSTWTQVTDYYYTFEDVTKGLLYTTSAGQGQVTQELANYSYWKCEINITSLGYTDYSNASEDANIFPLENLTINAPADWYISNQPLNVNFSATDYDNGINCSLNVNDATRNTSYNLDTNTNYNITYLPTTDGNQTWNMSCVAPGTSDAIYSVNRLFMYDTNGPTFSGYADNSSATYPEIGDTIALNVTVDDLYTIDYCQLYVNSTGTFVNYKNYSVNTNITIVLEMNYSLTELTPPYQGTMEWYVVCNDSVDNSNTSVTQSFTVASNTPPVITLNPTNAFNKSNVTFDKYTNTLKLNITLSDDLDLYSFNITIKNSTGSTKLNYYNNGLTGMTYYNYTSSTDISSWNEGNFTVEVVGREFVTGGNVVTEYYKFLRSSVTVAARVDTQNGVPATAEYTLINYCNITDYFDAQVQMNYTLYNGSTSYLSAAVNDNSGEINIYNLSAGLISVGDTWTLQCDGYTIASNASTGEYYSRVNITLLNVQTGEQVINGTINISGGYNILTNATSTLILPKGTYSANITVPGYIPSQENFTIYYSPQMVTFNLAFNATFILLDEVTGEPFNLSSADSIELQMYCPTETLSYYITDQNATLPIPCEYSKFKFIVLKGTTSYYRTFILDPTELLNLNVYLINLDTTTSLFITFTLDDIFSDYINPSVFVKKIINNATVQITADFADLSNQVGAYLVENSEYTVEVHSDNNPIKSMGSLVADIAGTKTLRLYTIGLGTLPETYPANYITSYLSNVSDQYFAYALVNISANDTVTWYLYDNIINGTLLYTTSTFGSSVEFEYNVTDIINTTTIVSVIAIGSSPNVWSWILNDLTTVFSLAMKDYYSQGVWNWAILLLLSVIALFATIKSGNMISLVLVGTSALFFAFRIFIPVQNVSDALNPNFKFIASGALLAIAGLVAVVSLFNSRGDLI